MKIDFCLLFSFGVFFSLQGFSQFEPSKYISLQRHWMHEEIVFRKDSSFYLRTLILSKCSDSIEGRWRQKADTIFMEYGDYKKRNDCSPSVLPSIITKYLFRKNKLYPVYMKRKKWKVSRKAWMLKSWN